MAKRKPLWGSAVSPLRAAQPALRPAETEHLPTCLNAYPRQALNAATAAFKACLKSNPDDPPAAVYLDRITQLRAKPPPAYWDGVWEFETK